jgi:DNA-directed RNA polymerase specialized sigma54-like protein
MQAGGTYHNTGSARNPFVEFAERVRARQRRKAAATAAGQRPHDDDHLKFLRRLMQPNVSLERVQREMYQRHFQDHAAASTVEALMFCLRERGTAALKEPKVSRRVRELSEPQMHEVCARLQKLKPEIAGAWSVNEVENLVNTWAVYHDR